VYEEQLDGLGVERDAAVGVGLFVSFSNTPAREVCAVLRSTPEKTTLEVKVTPAERAQLAAAKTRHHRQPQQQTHPGSRQALLIRTAASCADGGSGLVRRGAGAATSSAGFTERYRYRTARSRAPRRM
jgi:hypothetical protein